MTTSIEQRDEVMSSSPSPLDRLVVFDVCERRFGMGKAGPDLQLVEKLRKFLRKDRACLRVTYQTSDLGANTSQVAGLGHSEVISKSWKGSNRVCLFKSDAGVIGWGYLVNRVQRHNWHPHVENTSLLSELWGLRVRAIWDDAVELSGSTNEAQPKTLEEGVVKALRGRIGSVFQPLGEQDARLDMGVISLVSNMGDDLDTVAENATDILGHALFEEEIDAKREELRELLEDTVQIGEVTLASGAKSDFYIDGRKTSLSSRGLKLASEMLWERIKDLDVTAIGGPTMGADPLVAGVLMAAEQDGRPLKGFLIRKEKKDHGTQRWVEGPELKDGERVVVIEDVVTSGGSALRAIEGMKTQYQPEIVKIMCLVDREAGATEKLKEAGYEYEPLFTRQDLGR